MRNTTLYGWILACVCLLGGCVAAAEATPAPVPKPVAAVSTPPPQPAAQPAAVAPAVAAPKPVAPGEQAVARINELFKQDEATTREQAVTLIRSMLQSDPPRAISQLCATWLKVLADTKRYEDLADLAQHCIEPCAAETATLDQLLIYRVQALLALNKNLEALPVAKQLFDVATMKGTSCAILTLGQCLNAAYPDDGEILKKFRREQVEGARAPAATTTPADATASSVLAGIKLDPKPYDVAIRQLTALDYLTLVKRGNLMLLAGRNQEAWDTFELAYSLADGNNMVGPSENLARCMKAQDGSIGRANAWVVSIRPKPKAASLSDVKTDVPPKPQPGVNK